MAMYRKLGRTSDQRKALLRNQVTALIWHGKIVTTEAKAKEVAKIAESMIALAVKEKDNFEEVTVQAKVARKDKDGKRVKEVVDGKKVTVYDTVEKTIKKDAPSRLHARRMMLKTLYTPRVADAKGRKTVEVDISVGDNVRITGTAMDGFTGVVQSIDLEGRTCDVLVSMFGQQTPTTLAITDVRKMD